MTETAALGRAAVRGVGWGALATGVNLTAQIGFMAAMARLLDPADFGLVAMAHIACRFGSYFAQMGLAPALVQRPVLGPLDVRVALTLALALGGGFAAAIALAAPVAAWFFRTPELAALLRVLALGLLIGALGGVPLALLRRALRFRAVAAVEVSAYVLGYGAVGVACALAGLGAWSLVAAGLGQGLVVLIAASALARLPLRPAWDGAAARSLWAYGSRHSVAGFLEFLGANLESLAIGRLLGAAPLGLYGRAVLLGQLPAEHATGVVTRAVNPALARLQGDRAAFGRMAVAALGLVGLGTAVFAGGLAVAAADVVTLLLGVGWAEVAAVVPILVLATPFMLLTAVSGAALDALGAVGAKARVQTLMTVLRLAGLVPAAAFGLTGFAVLVVVAEALRCVAYGALLAWRVPLPGVGWLAGGVVAAGLGGALAVGGVAGLLGDAALPLRVAGEVLTGAVVLAGGLLAWRVLSAGSGLGFAMPARSAS